MDIPGQLEALRHSVPGCTLVAFADLRTRLVLCVSAAKSRSQERLDELCFQAAESFENSDMLAASLGTAKAASHARTSSVVLTPVETRVFIRPPDGDGEALCCVCDTPEHSTDLARNAEQALQQISGAI